MAINLGPLLAGPIKEVIGSLLGAIPGILYAIIIMLVGWGVAKIVSEIIRKVLRKLVKLDKWLEKQGLQDALGDISFTNVFTGLIYWWILVIFLGQAALQLKLGMVSDIILQFVLWTPNLFYGLLIFLGGFYLADFLTDKIKKSKNVWADRIGLILEPVIVFFISLIALGQIGVNVKLITDLVKILFGALAIGIALAIGLSFGLGMKDETPKMWKKMKKGWNKKRK